MMIFLCYDPLQMNDHMISHMISHMITENLMSGVCFLKTSSAWFHTLSLKCLLERWTLF